jgi:hypothetical protein
MIVRTRSNLGRRLALLLVLSFVGPAMAVERYTEARIRQIETSEANVLVFLDVVSGDAPPVGNGGSNESIKPYLILANSPESIASRKHLLANAWLAFTQRSVVRFRWDDAGANANCVFVMLVRLE